MEDNKASLKYLLTESDKFVITCEHIPGRVSRDKKLDEILSFAEKCRETGLVHALSLTDNPGGTPAISPDVLALEIEKIGIPALVHFPAKDMNRNMVESRALALDRMGLENILVMSGDFQTAGQMGLPMPVFDLDPVQILTLLSLMNKGKRVNFTDRSLDDGIRTNFFYGAVVSPYKSTEAGLMLQFYKMEKKVRAGAQFFITQLGFDARKLKDLTFYMRENGINVPVLGSVFILRKGAAAAMSRGDVAGAMVTDKLLRTVNREAEEADKGKAASLERAAMQVAVLMGLGFKGAHIEAMVLKFDMVETIISRAGELKPNWEECVEKLDFAPSGAFYLGATGAKAHSPATKKLKKGWGVYRVMRILHKLLFVKDGSLSGLMRLSSRILDTAKPLGAVSHIFEHGSKHVLFGCKDCGDCALPDMQFLCPQSQCPKQQRNGPCGGSRLDACEVYPERPCVWNRIYIRAKKYDELDLIRKTIIGPRDWNLRETSSWVNFHLNRDHACYDFDSFFKDGETSPGDKQNQD